MERQFFDWKGSSLIVRSSNLHHLLIGKAVLWSFASLQASFPLLQASKFASFNWKGSSSSLIVRSSWNFVVFVFCSSLIVRSSNLHHLLIGKAILWSFALLQASFPLLQASKFASFNWKGSSLIVRSSWNFVVFVFYFSASKVPNSCGYWTAEFKRRID